MNTTKVVISGKSQKLMQKAAATGKSRSVYVASLV